MGKRMDMMEMMMQMLLDQQTSPPLKNKTTREVDHERVTCQ